jgi:hypothetical protein
MIEHVPTLRGKARYLAYEGELAYRETEGGLLVPVQAPVFTSPWMGNLVTTSGKDLALDTLFSQLVGSTTLVNNVGVGTDTTAPSLTDTKLNPVVAGSVLIKTADAGASRTAEVVTIQATFGTADANFTWGEAGLFNGNVNGTSRMLDRLLVVPPFAKTSLLTVVVQFTITQT